MAPGQTSEDKTGEEDKKPAASRTTNLTRARSHNLSPPLPDASSNSSFPAYANSDLDRKIAARSSDRTSPGAYREGGTDGGSDEDNRSVANSVGCDSVTEAGTLDLTADEETGLVVSEEVSETDSRADDLRPSASCNRPMTDSTQNNELELVPLPIQRPLAEELRQGVPQSAKSSFGLGDAEASLDAPLVYTMVDPVPAAEFLTAELVNEAQEQQRIHAAEERGRESALAHFVEANVEPMPTSSGRDVYWGCKRCWRDRGPCFYFWLGVIVVILALALASALTAALVGEEDSPSSPRPLPVDLDPTGAPSVQNYIDPATCDLAVPLALDTAPTRSVLTIRSSTLFFNSCTENILVQNANWYSITAEDTPAVQATICEEGEGSSAISTDTILFLDVSVGDCEAKMCVPTVIRLKEASCLVFAWLVESGQAYNLAVFEAEGSPRVPFSLMVETTQSLDNLSCTEARAITIGESVSLDTLESDSYEANELELYTNCDGLQTDTPTRWYKVFGRGFGVTARICSRAALAIEVHTSSSCRNNTAHQCAKVSARKDDTFCTAYSWASGLESEHRVAIAAAQPEQNGGYSVEFLINDSCENALELPELPFSDSGNTRSIVPSFNTKAFVCLLLGDSFYKGVWYRWTASTEGCVTVSAKGANAVPFEERLDPAIAIYQGDCLTTLECVAMNEDASFFQADSEATFDPQVDTTYFVLVFETGGGSGAFEVEIKQSQETCSRSSSKEMCSLCPMGEEVPEKSCLYISEAVSATFVSGDSHCLSVQYRGVQQCGCAASMSVSCNTCPDGSLAPDTNKILPLSNITCGDTQTLPLVGNGSTCDDTALSLAMFCECPGSIPCSMCGENRQLTNPELIITESVSCSSAEGLIQRGLLSEQICDVTTFDNYLTRIYQKQNVVGFCCRGESLQDFQL